MGTLRMENATTIWEKSFPVRCFFYLVTPSETMPESVDAVPDVISMIIPYFVVLIAIEAVVCQFKGRFRLNDAVCSMSHAVLLRVFEFIGERHVEFVVYAFFYDNYRFLTLPHDSLLVWAAAMFATDHGYYWAHRFLHETAIGWASHQVHHSSEDFNLSTGVRQSIFQKYYCWPFYIPMALAGIPTQLFMIHMGIALIYQFTIHTELIGSLGPIGYVMNTPGAHQVHHGRNRECIDKNYAGVFVIWDRIYGTYQPRANVDDISYGLVGGSDSFDFFSIQFKYYTMLLDKVRRQKDYFRNVWYGPGWNKSKAHLRLGDPRDIPLPPKNLFNPALSLFDQVYVVTQLLTATAVMSHFLEIQSVYSNVPEEAKYTVATCFPVILWIYWTSINIGSILNKTPRQRSELARVWLTAYGCANSTVPVWQNLFLLTTLQALVYTSVVVLS